MSYTISHTLEHGIERIIYTPDQPRSATPILMQHGMWHGAWCWRWWQELLAEWGWQSIAISLPGQGKSPVQRPIRWCTLGYYFTFLQAEIARLPARPVLMGHSMGGALTQWYLKHGGDDLPAAVLVAPWKSNEMISSVLRRIPRDPVGQLLCFATLTATPVVRTPAWAADCFITAGAVVSPEALHAQLGPESGLVLLQYNPPLWRPARRTKTPLLWLAGASDALIPEPDEQRSAAHYGAEYHVIPEAGHNLMIEKSYRESAQLVHTWLSQRIPAAAASAAD